MSSTGLKNAAGLSNATHPVSHAYIADGETADKLAVSAVCSGGTKGATGGCGHCKNCDKASRQIHPDIITVSRNRDKRELTVDIIRDLKKDIYIAPNEAQRKVYIVEEAETMNVNAQNAFLLMLEEPPAHVVFILKTSNPAALLPTVRSRCVDLKTRSEQALYSEDLSELSQLAADFASSLGSNMRLTECMFRLDKLDRAAFSDFIALTREQLAGILRKDPQRKAAALADELFTEASSMLDLNVSTGHISGMICSTLME